MVSRLRGELTHGAGTGWSHRAADLGTGDVKAARHVGDDVWNGEYNTQCLPANATPMEGLISKSAQSTINEDICRYTSRFKVKHLIEPLV